VDDELKHRIGEAASAEAGSSANPTESDPNA
jgi:hypothetical protein